MSLHHLYDRFITYSTQDKEVHAKGRCYESQLHVDGEQDPEMDRVDVQIGQHGVENWNYHQEDGARTQKTTHEEYGYVDDQEEEPGISAPGLT